MVMKIIRKLEDLEEVREDDFVEVQFLAETGEQRDIPLSNFGIFYGRSIDGFSIVSEIATDRVYPIARVSYYWKNGTFNPSTDYYFDLNGKEEYYKTLLKKLSDEEQKRLDERNHSLSIQLHTLIGNVEDLDKL